MTTPGLAKPLPLPARGAPAAPQQTNRLSIAHLLFWTATTAIVLTYMQTREPPPITKLGFGTVLTQGEHLDLRFSRVRQAFWRRLRTQHVVGLVAAPIYGAAFAGAGLAISRRVRRRDGFPIQPGHWLLVAVAAVALVVAIVWPFLRRLTLPANAADFVAMGIVTAILASCTVRIRAPYYWRIPLGLATLGCGLTGASALLGVFSFSHDPLPFIFSGFMVGLLAIAAAPITALLCAGFDAAEQKEFDIFHWIGVASILGVVLHILATWTVGHYQL